MGASPEQQFDLACQNLSSVLDAAGASPDNIGLLTVFLRGHQYRGLLDRPWHETFPAPGDCPARKVTIVDLPGEEVVQLQAVAVLGEQRQVVEVPGLAHRDASLPMAVRTGDMVFSGAVGGQDPRTGELPSSVEGQMAQAHRNVAALVGAAGGTTDDIVHAWVFLRDYAHWDLSFSEWVKLFPYEGNRPARKTITPRTAAYDFLGDTHVQVQFTAALGGGRENFEVPGLTAHKDPIPLGAKSGGVLFSSGIPGSEPGSGRAGQGIEEQAELALQNSIALVEQAGGTVANIAHITVLTTEFGWERVLERAWQRAFPDPSDSPACQVMKWGTSGNVLFQTHIVAVF